MYSGNDYKFTKITREIHLKYRFKTIVIEYKFIVKIDMYIIFINLCYEYNA